MGDASLVIAAALGAPDHRRCSFGEASGRVYSLDAEPRLPSHTDLAPGMNSPALILFAHGARDPRWAEPFEAMRDGLLRQAPGRRIELAFLEFMQPSLPALAAAMAADGVTRAVVVPLFLATGAHLRRDLPAMIETLAEEHPGLALEVQVPLGESPAMRQAIIDWLAQF